jgi:hypothetical protein
MRRISTFSVVIILCLSVQPVFGQCSDAGVCLLGRKPEVAKHAIGLTYSYGKGTKEDLLMLHSVKLTGEFQLFEESRLLLEIPYSFQSGMLGSTGGIGDLSIVFSQTVFSEGISSLSFQVGGKFATGIVNSRNLPQAYQSGLGTNDLLAGVAFEHDRWNATVAYQRSRGRSDNRITRLKRGDDLLVRGGYRFIEMPAALHGEVLAIKRLEESSILRTAEGRPDEFISVPGSDQFQINLLGRAVYPIADEYKLQFLAAIPLLDREINLDGLTRSITLSAGVSYLF